MDTANYCHTNGLKPPSETASVGLPRGAMASSSRLFEIALQATVANADAARAESEQSGSGTQSKRPSTYASQTRSVHLTPQQWQLLNDYHEHELFIRTRSWGFCLAIFGVGLALFGCGSPAWKWIGNVRQPYEIGLWAICFPNNSTCLSLVYYLQDDWKVHTSIICFLGCACLFGILGLGLATTGTCRSALIPRLYYYHSAGECFLVSSISTVCSLALYPISASACIKNLINDGVIKLPEREMSNELENVDEQQRYAYTYYLTWVAAAFFMSSFFCMNLDLLIQSLVRPVPLLSAIASYCAWCKPSHCHCPCRRGREPRGQPHGHHPESNYPNQARSAISTSGLPKPSDLTRFPSPTRIELREQNTYAKKDTSDSDSGMMTRMECRNYPIPEILLSSYDEEASLEGQNSSDPSNLYPMSRTIYSRPDDVQRGDGASNENGDYDDYDDDNEEGDWI